MSNTNIGKYYEDLACEYLKNKGYTILTRNFRCRYAEIDIVSTKEKYICFCEVKYRTNSKSGHPEEAVNIKKQTKICKAALYYLTLNPNFFNFQIRFDVVAIENKILRYYENAFDFI